eukprot:TRINITY_DN59425_c0_g1_i1.p1 TRINITY_DN59425_c0_g1~~TRINITY_DN59425_c0_g1_i1.p1  ORF type:complete len:414 (+),score=32.59 TRINITY_DN59425_c0_g1_i1:133-1374(+)
MLTLPHVSTRGEGRSVAVASLIPLWIFGCVARPSGLWEVAPIPVYQNEHLSRTMFDSLVTNGSAFVVRGAATTSGLRNWTCSRLQADPDFRGAEVQLMYDESGEGLTKLSNDFEASARDSRAHVADESAPGRGPLYFGIKDIQFADADTPSSWTKGMLHKIQNLTHLPAFMHPENLWRPNPEGVSELDSFYSSPEMWISTASSGAQAHIDHHTSTTVSLQLSGSKRWRLSQVPARQSVTQKSLYGDGAIYHLSGKRWTPHYDMTLEEGDALFFPPGTIHETTNVGSSCALSITYQFSVPMPARYYRSNLRSFRRCGDMLESWALMDQWISVIRRLLHDQHDNKVDSLDRSILLRDADDVDRFFLQDAFTFVDTDGNDQVTTAELNDVDEEMRLAIAPSPAPPRMSRRKSTVEL